SHGWVSNSPNLRVNYGSRMMLIHRGAGPTSVEYSMIGQDLREGRPDCFFQGQVVGHPALDHADLEATGGEDQRALIRLHHPDGRALRTRPGGDLQLLVHLQCEVPPPWLDDDHARTPAHILDGQTQGLAHRLSPARHLETVITGSPFALSCRAKGRVSTLDY